MLFCCCFDTFTLYDRLALECRFLNKKRTFQEPNSIERKNHGLSGKLFAPLRKTYTLVKEFFRKK